MSPARRVDEQNTGYTVGIGGVVGIVSRQNDATTSTKPLVSDLYLTDFSRTDPKAGKANFRVSHGVLEGNRSASNETGLPTVLRLDDHDVDKRWATSYRHQTSPAKKYGPLDTVKFSIDVEAVSSSLDDLGSEPYAKGTLELASNSPSSGRAHAFGDVIGGFRQEREGGGREVLGGPKRLRTFGAARRMLSEQEAKSRAKLQEDQRAVVDRLFQRASAAERGQ